MAVEIKSYSKAQLAELYGVSLATIRVWIKKTPGIDYDNIRSAKILPPKLVSIIINHLGEPE